MSRRKFKRTARQTRGADPDIRKRGLGRAGREAVRDIYGQPVGGPRKMRDISPEDVGRIARARDEQ